jgi:hypothetical protein
VNIDISITKSVGVDVRIINSVGQVINNRHLKLTTGKNTISLDTWALPQGIYSLNIKSADGANISKSFTIIK